GRDAQRVVLQFAALGGHGHGAFGRTSQARHSLGDGVDLFQEEIGDLVEQFVQGDEMRTLHVPVCLLDLALQVNRIGQPIIEYDNDVTADFLRKINLRLVHRRSYGIMTSKQAAILHCLVMNPKEEGDVGRGVDRRVFGEAHLKAPSAGQAADRAEGQLQSGSEEAHIAAGDVTGLAVELRAQRPRRTEYPSSRKARECRTAVRRAGKYLITEGLRRSKLGRE